MFTHQLYPYQLLKEELKVVQNFGQLDDIAFDSWKTNQYIGCRKAIDPMHKKSEVILVKIEEILFEVLKTERLHILRFNALTNPQLFSPKLNQGQNIKRNKAVMAMTHERWEIGAVGHMKLRITGAQDLNSVLCEIVPQLTNFSKLAEGLDQKEPEISSIIETLGDIEELVSSALKQLSVYQYR